MAVKVNVNGSWKDSNPWVNVGGTWKPCEAVWVNVSGTWKKVWENWVSKTGRVAFKEQIQKDTNFGLFYDSGTVTLGRTMKLRNFRFLGEVIRVDITGRVPVRFEVYARRTGTSTWDKLIDKTTNTSNEWNTEFSLSVTSNTEYDAVQYKMYVHDTISRSYKARGYAYLEQWIQKGQ